VEKVKLFISYSQKDKEAAEKIEQNRKENGFDTWRDVTDIDYGENWPREIANNLANSDIIVLLWSRHAATLSAVKNEWLTARALEKGIILCFLEQLKNLPDDLKQPQALKHINGIHFNDFDTCINNLINTLSDHSSIDITYDYTKLPPHAFIPFRPNPNFVGRHTELLDLYLSLIGELNVVAINQVVNVFGLGGIGKTQLAVEFAYRFAFAFPEGVLRLNAARDWQAEFAGAYLHEKRVAFLNRAAINLYTAYNDFLRLEREYLLRGVDSVIDDIQLAIVWCKTGTQHVDDLANLQRVLDRERHNLRVDAHASSPVQQDPHFLQQLHYRAHAMGMDSLAKKMQCRFSYKRHAGF